MWCYRRMLRISYTDRKSNEEVLRIVKAKRELLETFKNRKIKYFGHVIREEGLMAHMVMGKINPTRGQASQPGSRPVPSPDKWGGLVSGRASGRKNPASTYDESSRLIKNSDPI